MSPQTVTVDHPDLMYQNIWEMSVAYNKLIYIFQKYTL